MNPVLDLINLLRYLLLRKRGNKSVYLRSIFDFSFVSKRMTTQKSDYPLSKDIDLSDIKYSVVRFKPGFTKDHIFTWDHKSANIGVSEIRECERLLRAFVHSYNTDESIRKQLLYSTRFFSPIDLQCYGRQYMPVVSVNGEKLVFLNCFCNPGRWRFNEPPIFKKNGIFGLLRLSGWDKGFIDEEDGGNCYFRLKINLDKGEVFEYYENGEA
jgi:hypothetical protein